LETARDVLAADESRLDHRSRVAGTTIGGVDDLASSLKNAVRAAIVSQMRFIAAVSSRVITKAIPISRAGICECWG
jgi:hypothetical protein